MAIIDGPFSHRFQFTTGRLLGSTLDAAFPRATTFRDALGVVILKDDPLGPSFAITGLDSGDAPVWVTQGYGSGRWGKYVIGPAVQGAPYQTIAAAQAAAVADGFTGAGNPVGVFEILGDLTEDVVYQVNSAFVGHGRPQIAGSWSLGTSGAGGLIFANLALSKATAAGVGVLGIGVGAHALQVFCTNVTVECSAGGDGDAIRLTAAPLGSIAFESDNCTALASGLGAALNIGARAFVADHDCVFANLGTTGHAILVDGSILSRIGEIDGRVRFTSNANNCRLYNGNILAPNDVGAGGALIELVSTDTDIRLLGCMLEVDPSLAMDVIRVTGTVVPNLSQVGTQIIGKNTVVNTTGAPLCQQGWTSLDIVAPTLYGALFTAIALPGAITVNPLEACVMVDTTGAAGQTPVNLPSLSDMQHGQAVTICCPVAAAVNGLDITPVGAERINGVNAPIVTASGAQVTLRAVVASLTPTWVTVSAA